MCHGKDQWDLSEKGTTRAEDAQTTPTQSQMSPSIPAYEAKSKAKNTFVRLGHPGVGEAQEAVCPPAVSYLPHRL